MATVVETTQPQTSVINSTSGVLSGMIGFFYEYWTWMLVSVCMLILGIIVYYLVMKLEEERKERDDVVYATFKDVKRDCTLHADSKKIKRTWSMINLLWFGLPFVKHEHSAKILNFRGDMLGWYRGETCKQEGTINFLAYKERFFFFFEDTYVIKMPKNISLSIDKKIYNKQTKKYEFEKDAKGVIVKERVPVNFDNFITYLPNGDIQIWCISLEKIGYYSVPVLLDKNNCTLDFREELGHRIIDSSYNTMLQRVLSEGTKMVEKAIQHNPYLLYEQKSPEKTKEESKHE